MLAFAAAPSRKELKDLRGRCKTLREQEARAIEQAEEAQSQFDRLQDQVCAYPATDREEYRVRLADHAELVRKRQRAAEKFARAAEVAEQKVEAAKQVAEKAAAQASRARAAVANATAAGNPPEAAPLG